MKLSFLTLLLLFFITSCSKNDDASNTSPDPLTNFTSQQCSTVNGPTAYYWDFSNGQFIPLAEVPLVTNPGQQFIHSQYPALGFTMPAGYQGFELFNPQTNTIGVNVIRNDNQVVWRYVPSGTFNGSIGIGDVMAFEINSMLNFYNFNGTWEVLCTDTRQVNTGGNLTTTFSARLLRFGNFTGLVWANTHFDPVLNITYLASSTSVALTAEYDAMVRETFLPLSWQLLVGPGSVQDSDLDGTPDSQDNFPFDPTRQ